MRPGAVSSETSAGCMRYFPLRGVDVAQGDVAQGDVAQGASLRVRRLGRAKSVLFAGARIVARPGLTMGDADSLGFFIRSVSP